MFMYGFSVPPLGGGGGGGGGRSQAIWDKILTFAKNYFTAFFSYDWGDAD